MPRLKLRAAPLGSDPRRIVLRIPDLRKPEAIPPRTFDEETRFVLHTPHDTVVGPHLPDHTTRIRYTPRTESVAPPPVAITVGVGVRKKELTAPSTWRRFCSRFGSVNPLSASFDSTKFDHVRQRLTVLLTLFKFLRNPTMILGTIAIVSAQLTGLMIWLESDASPVRMTSTPPPQSSFTPTTIVTPLTPAAPTAFTESSSPTIAPPSAATSPTLTPSGLPTLAPPPAGKLTPSVPSPKSPSPIMTPVSPRFEPFPQRLGDPQDKLPWESRNQPKRYAPDGSAQGGSPAAQLSTQPRSKKKTGLTGAIEPADGEVLR